MNDQLQLTKDLLETAGYSTWQIESDISSFGFEDEATLGFVSIFADPPTLLRDWRATESSLLSSHALALRKAGEKVWNIYSVLLTAVAATDEEVLSLKAIEENLERTRKITSDRATNRDTIQLALLPLLPIASKPIIESEDAYERLKRRIAAISPGNEVAALNTDVPPEVIAKRLTERQ